MARSRTGRLRARQQKTFQAAAPDPDGQALIYGAKIAPPDGGVQGGDFSAFLA
jgi:hypothetical protein